MSLAASALTDFRPTPFLRSDDLSGLGTSQGSTLLVSVQSGRAPVWLPYVVLRLNELSRLHTEPADEVPIPHPGAIQRALPELSRFMRDDSPTPSVVPTSDGEVRFVWHKGGWDIEIDVGPVGTSAWAQRRAGSEALRGSLSDRLRDIQSVLQHMGTG